MSQFAAARLAIAIGVLALSASEVSACGLWFCREPDYPPMRVPTDDQRVGPTWTRNGWVYLPAYGHAPPVPYADPGYGLKDFERPRAPWRAERPANRRW